MFKHSYFKFFLICILLFLLGAGLRLYRVSQDTPQPDELHWRLRSHDALNNLKKGEWFTYNMHLGHPGIPATMLYGATEYLIDEYNQQRDLEEGEEKYIDHLSALRVANAVFSSLVFPVIFLICLVLFGVNEKGFSVGLISSLFFIFSPHHLDASRMAHIDSVLTLFVSLTVFFFLLSEKTNKAFYGVFSGLSWGFAIATKPTAAFIIPAFILFRLFRRYVFQDNKCFIVYLKDLWILFIGHLVLAGLYTRLWQHESKYVTYYHINPLLTRVVYHLGVLIQNFPLIIFLMFALLLSNLFKIRFSVNKEYVIRSLSILILSCFIFLGLFPDIATNIVRFWLWAAGLSEMTHRAYGITWEPLKYGYLGIIFTKLSLIILSFACFGILATVFEMSRVKDKKAFEAVILLVALVVVWVSLLSVSPKQTIRYVVPALPFFYVLSGIGVYQGAQFLTKNLRMKFCIYVLLLANSAFVSLKWFPHFGLFCNALSGDTEGEIKSGRPLRVVGTEEAINFLHNTALTLKHDLIVSLMGDQELMDSTYRRRYKKNERKLTFIFYEKEHPGDFLLIFPGFLHFLDNQPLDTEFKEVFSYNFRQTPMLKVFEAPYLSFLKGKELDLQKLSRSTGGGGFFEGKIGRVVESGTDQKGYMVFGAMLRIRKGQYEILSPAVVTDTKELKGSEGVYRIELGKCHRIVRANELKKDKLTTLSANCEFEKDTRAQFRVYWFGDVSIYLGNPSIKAIGENSY